MKFIFTRPLVYTVVANAPFGTRDQNCFGAVMAEGYEHPVICGHGGSEWLCWTCAAVLHEQQNQPTGIAKMYGSKYWQELEQK